MIELLDEMKSYVGFDADDAAHLRQLATSVSSRLGEVVDRFYGEILQQPGARRVLTGDAEQLDRLRQSLRVWLETMFSGRYDAQYARVRSRVGQTHVQVALPQHYMFAAIEIIWQELVRIITELDLRDKPAKLAAVHKLLTIETALMLDSYRRSYAGRIRDLERASIEDRLSRAEQLAEIGQLAASIAHEIKNPLAGISGAIQVLRRKMNHDDEKRDVLDEVLRQVRRVDGTVRDLLVFAKPHAAQRRVCDLQTVIERSTILLGQKESSGAVKIEVTGDCALPRIEADEHQIEQLLVNLLLNAAQASKPGDRVRLRTACDDSTVTLAIEDEGKGIPPGSLDRVFEPFYTTKTQGTGLGLTIARRIVEDHGGTISVDSRPARGTVVTVRLPRKVKENGLK